MSGFTMHVMVDGTLESVEWRRNLYLATNFAAVEAVKLVRFQLMCLAGNFEIDGHVE